MLFYKNWIEIKNFKMKLNNYMDMVIEDNLEKNLIKQSNFIYNNFSNIVVSVSGGVDSQTAAYGFIKAKLPVKYLFLKIWFEGNYNKEDYFYAKEFCDENNVELDIFEYEYTKESLQDLILEQDYFNSCRGFGTLLQLNCFEQYKKEQKNINIVGAPGNFLFEREKNICKGLMPNFSNGVTTGFNENGNISFFYYTPLIFKYYEIIHKKDKRLQFLKNYQPKNLAFTELGFPLRPKLNSWEQHHKNKDYINLTLIDIGNDKGPKLEKNKNSQRILLDSLGYSENIKNKIMGNKPHVKEYIELYNFKTTINL